MRSVVAWAIRNTPSMNTLMAGVLAVGVASMLMLQRERFPDYRPDEVVVRVVYPGGEPDSDRGGTLPEDRGSDPFDRRRPQTDLAGHRRSGHRHGGTRTRRRPATTGGQRDSCRGRQYPEFSRGGRETRSATAGPGSTR
ncbi:MAG: hypothetical protein CM1200mP2_38510 [Planctomycetaceae bacterium]|nr:MAG: hypothetical protein CM1200mP2_38510 [Planctomycetaceae bacterium]